MVTFKDDQQGEWLNKETTKNKIKNERSPEADAVVPVVCGWPCPLKFSWCLTIFSGFFTNVSDLILSMRNHVYFSLCRLTLTNTGIPPHAWTYSIRLHTLCTPALLSKGWCCVASSLVSSRGVFPPNLRPEQCNHVYSPTASVYVGQLGTRHCLFRHHRFTVHLHLQCHHNIDPITAIQRAERFDVKLCAVNIYLRANGKKKERRFFAKLIFRSKFSPVVWDV